MAFTVGQGVATHQVQRTGVITEVRHNLIYKRGFFAFLGRLRYIAGSTPRPAYSLRRVPKYASVWSGGQVIRVGDAVLREDELLLDTSSLPPGFGVRVVVTWGQNVLRRKTSAVEVMPLQPATMSA